MHKGLIMKQMKCTTIIKIQGHLNGKWKECFEGMEISYEGNDTILTGNLKDEAQMHGVLNIIRDYNLILISINSGKGNLMFRVRLRIKQ